MTNKQRAEFRGGDDWKGPPKPKPKLKATKSVPVLPAGPVPRLLSRSTSRAHTAVLQIPACSHAYIRRVNDPPQVMNNDISAVPGPYLEPIVTKCNKQTHLVSGITSTRCIPPPRVLTLREFNRDKDGKKIVRSLSGRSPGESQCDRERKHLAYLVVDLETGRPIFRENATETKSEAIGCKRTKRKPLLPTKSATMSSTGERRPVPLPRKKSLKKKPLSPPTAAMETEEGTEPANTRVVQREPLLPPSSEGPQDAAESSLADRVQQFLLPTTKSVSEPQNRPRPIPRPRSFSTTPSPTPAPRIAHRHSAPADPQKNRTPPSSPTAAPEALREHLPPKPKPKASSNSKVKPTRPPPPNPMALQRAKANKAASLRNNFNGPEMASKKRTPFTNVGTQSLRPAATSNSNSHAGLKTKPLSRSCGNVQVPSSNRTAASRPLPLEPHPGIRRLGPQQSRTTEPKAHPDYEDIDPDDDEPKPHPDYEDMDPDDEPKPHPDYEDMDSDDEEGDVVDTPLPDVPSTPPPRLPPKPQSKGKPFFQRKNRETSVSSVGSLSGGSNGTLSSISELKFDDDDHIYELVDTSIPIPPPRRKRKPKLAGRSRSHTLGPQQASSKAPPQPPPRSDPLAPPQPPPRSDPLKRRDPFSRTVPTSSLATTAPSRVPSGGNSSVLQRDTFPSPNQEPTSGGTVGDRLEGVGIVLEEPDVGGVDEYVDFDPAPAWEQSGRTEETQLDMENDHPSESYVEMHPSKERPTVIAAVPASDPLYIQMDPNSYIPTPGLYYASKDLLAERPDLKTNKKGRVK